MFPSTRGDSSRKTPFVKHFLANDLDKRVEPARAGFTLIEALVALAVIAASLAAIASVISTNVRASRALDQRLALIEATRAILTGLPDRLLVGRNSAGETRGYKWRVDFRALPVEVDSRRPIAWLPQSVIVTVEGPTRQVMRIETVRLQPAQAVQRER